MKPLNLAWRSAVTLFCCTSALALRGCSNNRDSPLQTARELLFVKHYDSALAAANNAIMLDPMNPSAHIVQGTALIYEGRPADAEKAFDIAIMLDKKATATVARAYLEAGKRIAGDDDIPVNYMQLLGLARRYNPGLSGEIESVLDSVKEIPGMVWIPGGSFMMGSHEGKDDEEPVHRVTISGFFIDRHPVTQAEYKRVMGNNPSCHTNCPQCPVENVTWENVEDYCCKTGKWLPTEAQWEYACRAGSSMNYYWGDDTAAMGEYAWYDKNSGRSTRPVARKRPNPFGLYDMIGNVWQWCNDWYGPYASGSQCDPQGASSGSFRVLRGGSWNNDACNLRCANRGTIYPGGKSGCDGFVCVRLPQRR